MKILEGYEECFFLSSPNMFLSSFGLQANIDAMQAAHVLCDNHNLKMYHTKRGSYIKVSETCLDVAGPVCYPPSLPGLVSAITRACS